MTNHKPDIRKANLCPPCPPTATAWEKLIYWLGIGLGSGLPKKAPGTWGTVGGLIVAIPLMMLGFLGFLVVIILGCLVGSYICGKTSDLMNVHDDPHIVWDEWVGMWITLLPIVWVIPLFKIPCVDGNDLMSCKQQVIIYMLILAFILFRFFDIIKPFPIKWVDKNVSGGFGILIDDVLAGVMAGGMLWFMLAFLTSM
ncbi:MULTISPECIES: phosphatidylglycerophosphatase A [unclassified Moraxella]|uniref:phosphatidylglycerophosphatase A family protein n=1 Tax=unclassified Moraxella TaxID=2685852 RepID=UPI003AF91B63